MQGRILIIAGSDCGGGAGIQADIKTVTCLGGFAMTAITALTAQNTQGVWDILDVPAPFVARQIEVVLDDLGADCIKVGMLHQPEVIEEVTKVLATKGKDIPLVLDPVMVAKGGAPLLAMHSVTLLKSRLLPMARLLTPNIPEAEALTGLTIKTEHDARMAGKMLADMGSTAVLMKGGHLKGETIVDFLFEDGHLTELLSNPRIDTPHTHGTGCTTASAIATGLAQGMTVKDAVVRAHAYVFDAICQAPGFGHGHGPLNHAYQWISSKTK